MKEVTKVPGYAASSSDKLWARDPELHAVVYLLRIINEYYESRNEKTHSWLVTFQVGITPMKHGF